MFDLPNADALAHTRPAKLNSTPSINLDYYLEAIPIRGRTKTAAKSTFRLMTAQPPKNHRRHRQKSAGCTRVIKSKSMAINRARPTPSRPPAWILVETDLGEFIIKISHDKPSHIVAPVMHKDQSLHRQTLQANISKSHTTTIPTDLPPRPAYISATNSVSADLGITGGNSPHRRRPAKSASSENEQRPTIHHSPHASPSKSRP